MTDAPERIAGSTSGNYFGDCPHCFKSNGFVNVASSHFGICNEHRVFWPIGANLFSNWREESQEDWDRNRKLLLGFTRVKPVRLIASRLYGFPVGIPCLGIHTDDESEICNSSDPPVRVFIHASLDPGKAAAMLSALALDAQRLLTPAVETTGKVDYAEGLPL